jgi:NAD(P)-dependent dehydrogenase (short-subunit alcohol dehydrogenase family)
MSVSLAGKVALVVGASQGVGRAYALGLAAAGVHVAAVARKVLPSAGETACLREVMEAGRALGPPILGLGADISRKEDISRVVDETMASLGRIDILVLNAVYARFSDAFDVPDEDWERSFALNVRAPYTFIKLVAPQMMDRRAGSIICMSTRGSLPIPIDDSAHKGLLAYGTSKAAFNRIATYFSEELKPYNIAVNMLSPGKVAELAGGKDPTPEQFAPPLLYLARQTAETMTGQFRNTTDWNVSWP